MLESHTAPFDSKLFRNTCGLFATGVTIVTTELDGEAHGMTVNGFMSVSLDPALVVISIGHTSRMHKRLQETGNYAISFLTQPLEAWSSHFAGWEQPDLDVTFDRFAGKPVVPEALAYLSAEIIDAHPAGDHTLYIARVDAFATNPEAAAPLLFYKGRYNKMAEEQSK